MFAAAENKWLSAVFSEQDRGLGLPECSTQKEYEFLQMWSDETDFTPNESIYLTEVNRMQNVHKYTYMIH